ncbi:MAG: response regulator [Gammaproteobacteria bacterium]|nr:MAG: response regulator [Gammaproteobacteria bacterium]
MAALYSPPLPKVPERSLPMPTPVLICDDSSFARKQMARAIPSSWDVEIHFASSGEEALEAIREGRGDILFLDLNMPGLDGYGVLETIRREDLPSLVVVVSGDVQPEARERVRRLGALEFIRKPIDPERVTALLDRFGIRLDRQAAPEAERRRIEEPRVTEFDIFQEIANVAMGRAADLLARYLGVFVQLPVPEVRLVDRDGLAAMLPPPATQRGMTAVSQGFMAGEIAGEALLLVEEGRFRGLGSALTGEPCDEDELRMDAANLLIGACLRGIAEPLDLDFGLSHPVLLPMDPPLAEQLRPFEEALAFRFNYRIEDHQAECDLLLLFTPQALPALSERVGHLDD